MKPWLRLKRSSGPARCINVAQHPMCMWLRLNVDSSATQQCSCSDWDARHGRWATHATVYELSTTLPSGEFHTVSPMSAHWYTVIGH